MNPDQSEGGNNVVSQSQLASVIVSVAKIIGLIKVRGSRKTHTVEIISDQCLKIEFESDGIFSKGILNYHRLSHCSIEERRQ